MRRCELSGRSILVLLVFSSVGFTRCDSTQSERQWRCVSASTEPDFLQQIGCAEDFDALSSIPVSAGIPGTLSVKTLVDRLDGDALYFQNSRKYRVHYDFASAHLSGNGQPIVPLLTQFNQTEYYSPDRRFLLGALNYYEGPGVWAYEISPYDTASAEMIESAFRQIQKNTYFGADIVFHPTSDAVAQAAKSLPGDIPVMTTDELFEDIDYQPLNLGTSMGQLRFVTTQDLERGDVSFRDIAVLDIVPNDIAVVSGIITAEFQTPLSHINVLSQNRGTPNMGLKGSFDDPRLRALAGKWVELNVGPFEYSVTEVSKERADEWWKEHMPEKVGVPELDLSVKDLRDVEDILDIEGKGLATSLAEAIPAFGGKASHYAAFPYMDGEVVPFPKAFAIPVYYYRQFMEQNGFDARVAAMIADEKFSGSPVVRKLELENLRDDIKLASVDKEFEDVLLDKLRVDYAGIRMRFRSSTNCEDLDGFTGAGLYTSKSGDPADSQRPVLDAVRKVWASVWNFRAFEEREYRSIPHAAVGMALLVHRSFPEEEINGVAVTANLFDALGMEPGFYINAQLGDVSVVIPPNGVTSDQLIFHYNMPGQPIVFMAHSNLIPEGQTVMTRAQTATLGRALKAIHEFFNPLYGPATQEHFYAMDVEFKFDGEPGEEPALFIKQARPYPGWGMNNG